MKSPPSASLTLVASGSNEQNEIKRKACGTLTAFYDRLNNGSEESLKAGMLIQWKPGMKNKRTPNYGDPAIVMEVLASPLFAVDEGPYSPYFREPLDIIIGLISDDGALLVYHVDSRRFALYSGPGATFD